MKTIQLIFLIISLLISANLSYSQVLNWASLDKTQRHIVNANIDVEFGISYALGYGYQLKTNLPIVLTIQQSHPSGGKFFEDFQTKIGGQIRLVQIGDFHVATRLQGLFRRYENPIVRLLDFGSDVAGTFGYFRPKWFVAGEVGFDKAIVTHFKHSPSYLEDFPTAQEGWYEATGGNFYYGLQAGFSFKRNDIYLKGGNLLQQDFKTKPFLPFYVQLGYNRRF
jgi:hypothetical protein